jgi:diacylglycerol kinase (ATP)
MRAAAIFGLESSPKDLKPFQQIPNVEWRIGMPDRASEADAIFVFGGDGTIHRHLSSLVELNLPVLVVPSGSGNDFARALNLRTTRDSLVAWQRFSTERNNVRTIDLGVIRPLTTPKKEALQYFCCVAGIGLDAEVASRANRLPRWLRRHGGYVLSLPGALAHMAAMPVKISIPTDDHEGWRSRSSGPLVLASVANAPFFGGGMRIAPQAKLDDGQLDVCLIRSINPFRLFCLFPTVYFGRHLGIKEVEYFHANRLRIETEFPLDVYADGEFVCQTPIEVGVAPCALRVVVPA